jgi:hypothetical protein
MKPVFWLTLIFLLGLGLRLCFLPLGALTFSFDQGRDAFISQSIFQGNLKIQGPSSSTPGLFHGVFYYYLLAPFYLLGHGNPFFAATGLAVLNCLGIILMYYFARLLTKNTYLALCLSLLYAASFEQSQYAIWLSNPSYAAFTIPLFYYFLWHSHREHFWSYVASGIFLGLSIQADIFLAYHLISLIVLWLTRHLPFKWSFISRFGIGLFVGAFPILLAQIKFGFTGLSAVSGLILPGSADPAHQVFSDTAFNYLNQLTRTFSLNLFPIQIFLGGIIGLFLVCRLVTSTASSFNKTIILTYVLSSAIAIPFGGVATPFINVGIGFGIYLLLGMFLHGLWAKNRIPALLIIALVLLANLISICRYNSSGQTIFALQRDLTLKHELAALHFIYTTQAGRPFSLNTITSPLHINTAWSYLFNWYGQSHFRSLPYWHGHNQIGSLGNNLLPPPIAVTDYYLIIDPPEPNFVQFIDPGIREENGFSTLLQEYRFGAIRVQKRLKLQ